MQDTPGLDPGSVNERRVAIKMSFQALPISNFTAAWELERTSFLSRSELIVLLTIVVGIKFYGPSPTFQFPVKPVPIAAWAVKAPSV